MFGRSSSKFPTLSHAKKIFAYLYPKKSCKKFMEPKKSDLTRDRSFKKLKVQKIFGGKKEFTCDIYKSDLLVNSWKKYNFVIFIAAGECFCQLVLSIRFHNSVIADCIFNLFYRQARRHQVVNYFLLNLITWPIFSSN